MNHRRCADRCLCSDIEEARAANTKGVRVKEDELRQELDVLLRQPLKYTSDWNESRSYPLLFGDPDQLASKRRKRQSCIALH